MLLRIITKEPIFIPKSEAVLKKILKNVCADVINKDIDDKFHVVMINKLLSVTKRHFFKIS